MPEFEEAGLKVTIGAPVKNFDAEEFMGRREYPDRPGHALGLYASKQALEDSGIDLTGRPIPVRRGDGHRHRRDSVADRRH